ncbi:MAG: sugar ABC transporter substrate-binding protein [[Clostridium] cellulosi]|nr:MAG: sugar ABC transporter substrate-binding protein [[Clostridium] cellulosi]
MVKFVRALSAALAAVIVAGSFVGCGSKTSSNNAASSNDNTPVTITHWLWVDSADYMQTMNKIADDFHSKYPNITVKMQTYAYSDFSNTLTTALAGGGGPDTASFKLTWTPAYTQNNYLLALDDAVDKWEGKSEILPMLWDKMKEAGGGKIYTMPWTWQVLYVYYRPSYFKAVGIDSVPKTFDEFIEDIKKCTTTINGKKVYGFGLRGASGGQEPWGSFIQAYGGRFADENNKVILNSPETVKGTQVFIDLYKNGYAPKTAVNDGLAELKTMFNNGQIAMFIHHIGSSVDMVKANGDDVDAFPVPKGPGGQWTSMGDTENVVIASTKHQDAAIKWVEYLASADAVKKWDLATGNLPVVSSVAEAAEFKDNKFMKVSMESQSYAGIFPILPTTANWVNNVWAPVMQQALMGKISAEEAVKQLDAQLKGQA